jgi:hypothetical protein
VEASFGFFGTMDNTPAKAHGQAKGHGRKKPDASNTMNAKHLIVVCWPTPPIAQSFPGGGGSRPAKSA